MKLFTFVGIAWVASSNLPTQSESFAQSSAKSPEISTSLTKWEDKHIKLLIDCYSQEKKKESKGKNTKKEMFESVARQFNAKATDVKVTGEQCQRKWIKLEQKYKEVEDHNRKTGRAKKSWKFMEAMCEIMGTSPNVNPAYTFDTSVSDSQQLSPSSCSASSDPNNSASESSDTENNSENSQTMTAVQNRKRTRKSKSSASEMLEFLKDYSEKREKSEKEKVDLLREMHEEKKQFFTQFLEVLKKK